MRPHTGLSIHRSLSPTKTVAPFNLIEQIRVIDIFEDMHQLPEIIKLLQQTLIGSNHHDS
jgi:hypothetical protein